MWFFKVFIFLRNIYLNNNKKTNFFIVFLNKLNVTIQKGTFTEFSIKYLLYSSNIFTRNSLYLFRVKF